MASIKNLTLNIKAGVSEELPIRGDGLRLVSVTSRIKVYFKTSGGELDFYLEEGEQILFEEKVFKRIEIYHKEPTDQEIVISVSEGSRFNGVKIAGKVSLEAPFRASALNKLVIVPSANFIQLVPENLTRNYLRISHQDAFSASLVMLRFGGSTQDFMLQAKEFLEFNNTIVTSEIFAKANGGFPVEVKIIEG